MLDDDAGLNLALRRPFNAFKANAACAESASYITPKSFSQRIQAIPSNQENSDSKNDINKNQTNA